MAQQPFTTAGVAAKQAELNALSNSDLATQANEIRNNFQEWMISNFILDASQTASLNSLNPDFLDYTSFVVSYAVNHRLPVNVDKHGAESSGKLLHTTGGISVSTSSSGSTSVSGTVQIDITYS